MIQNRNGVTHTAAERVRLRRPALLDNLRPQPNREIALARYAQLAERYEGTTTRIREIRTRAIDLLELKPGETVFDVACGAGAILRELASRVEPRGRVIGIEQSAEMAELARGTASGRPSIEILHAPVETFAASRTADALVFCYTHDVLQNPAALANLFAQVRPGARVAVAGLCLLPWWGTAANAWVIWGARHYLTTWHGLRAPWRPLLPYCPDLRVVERYHWGTGYLATGTVGSTERSRRRDLKSDPGLDASADNANILA